MHPFDSLDTLLSREELHKGLPAADTGNRHKNHLKKFLESATPEELENWGRLTGDWKPLESREE